MVKIGQIFIDVYGNRARVSRYTDIQEYSVTWEFAANWEELEQNAIDAVMIQYSWPAPAGHYLCPEELAKDAKFYVKKLMNVNQKYGDYREVSVEEIYWLCEESGLEVPLLEAMDTVDELGRPIIEYVDVRTMEVVLREVYVEEREEDALGCSD